jgi:sortase A
MIERDRRRTSVRWLEGGLILLGLVLVGVWLVNSIETRTFQSTESRKLDSALRNEQSAGTPQTPGAAQSPAPQVSAKNAAPYVTAKSTAAPGSATRSAPSGTAAKGVLGRIEIPRLRISGMIAEGTDNGTLKRAVGHVVSTAQPGDAGNVGLAAHRDGLFRGLGAVRKNDLVRIVTIRGTYTYRVEWMEVVDPHRVDVLDSTAEPSLTLVTCYPFDFIGHAPKRFVVRARQFQS